MQRLAIASSGISWRVSSSTDVITAAGRVMCRISVTAATRTIGIANHFTYISL